jgi:uncharacterized protein (TIRG00374 family)
MSLIFFFIVLTLGMILLVVLKIPLEKIFKNSKGFVYRAVLLISKFLQGWELIVKDRGAFNKLLLLALGNVVLNVVIIYIQFVSIGKVSNILDITLYTCISGLTLFVSITPGSLGIREGVLLITSQSLGLSENEIVKLALLDRGIMFVLLLICMILIYIFVKRFNLRELFFGKEKDI